MKLSPQVNSFRGLPAAAMGELFDSFARRVCANAVFPDVNSGIHKTASPHQGLGRDFHRFFQTIEAPPLRSIWFIKNRFRFAERQFFESGRCFSKGPALFLNVESAAGICFFFAKDGA